MRFASDADCDSVWQLLECTYASAFYQLFEPEEYLKK